MRESTPLLATKLYRPPARPNVVPRPRLMERLNAGLQRKLTLVAAPAGFGKTTLLSEWLAGCGRPVAWLSLDDGDNDATRFLTYLVAALQTVVPQMGTALMALLQSPQPPPVASLLTPLLNEIAACPDHFVFVLDDYHAIEAEGVDGLLTFLVEHLPPQLHLVIATREDPALPLARLRARGQLTEVRAADLRFTPAEAADFLNRVMGLSLAAQEIATLDARTEGWIAGLQLAALSLQDHQDVSGFVRTFAGDHRYILDYLVEEVLQRQPEPVRTFLLQTAILDRLYGPLCDAVTGGEGGRAQLDALQRGNFFVAPLDDTRQWYRYHHLFAEVLAAQLQAEQPDLVSTLHRRASAWYEQHGSVADAIRHALAAPDFARAADLVELAMPAMRRTRQEAMLLSWLKALPDDVLRNRPVLSAIYGGTLLQSGELAGVERRLQDAERWLDKTPAMGEPPYPLGAVVVDQEEFRRLPAWLAIYRAGQALMRGNVQETLTYAQRAHDRLTADDPLGHGAAAALLGLAYWTRGDLEAAYRTYTEGMASLQRVGFLSDVIGGAIAQADIRITQGRLREALHIYEQALQLATAQGPSILRGTADMHVGLSELYRERNDLATARQHLARSQALGDHLGFPQNPYRWRVAMARLQEAEGDLGGALALLQEAERLYVSDFYPNIRPVAALRVRLWLAQGQLDAALAWAQEQGLSAQDELSYLREFEHITLARVLLAHQRHDQAAHGLAETIRFLARLLQAAKAGGRVGRVIEILVLQALAHQAQGDQATALLPLARALTLAEPEGYVRIFVDEGKAMRLLISAFRSRMAQQPAAEQNRNLSVYADKLLAAFNNQPSTAEESLLVEQPEITNPQSPIPNLIEPLSERELDVLRLFNTELSGPEIAQHLMIGLSTVRTHTKSIYSKLNVNSRRAAVNRAVELDLI
ncbi:MAG: LuxR C-terminal-related transcriptional regulator [Caldilineaceae bacterium]